MSSTLILFDWNRKSDLILELSWVDNLLQKKKFRFKMTEGKLYIRWSIKLCIQAHWTPRITYWIQSSFVIEFKFGIFYWIFLLNPKPTTKPTQRPTISYEKCSLQSVELRQLTRLSSLRCTCVSNVQFKFTTKLGVFFRIFAV